MLKPSRPGPTHQVLEDWLRPLDACALECDGMTQAIAALLSRESIRFMPMVGHLTVDGVGTITPHCWIVLDDGAVCDLRARMWLGDSARVPHGVAIPGDGIGYGGCPAPNLVYSDWLFQVMTGMALSDYQCLPRERT